MILKKNYSSSFFTSMTAEQLWKGVTSVSNAGRKKGRGRGTGRKIAKDLNVGQIIGVGKKNMVWPGLNAPVFRGKEIVEQRALPENADYEENLIKIRNEMIGFRRLKLQPLERGYSGNKIAGRKFGPPDPIGEETFENFESIVLESKVVSHMTGNLGRKRRFSILAVTGNKNGIAGFALVKLPDARAAIRKGKNRAAQSLRFIERFEEHTVCHDFFTRFGPVKLYVSKKPKGYGLNCHRVLRSICEVAGIKDIKVEREGSKCVLSMVKAFFLGLQKQKTHQQIANEKGLHVVEFRKENDYFPRVIASPERCRTEEEILPDEELDYDLYMSEGRLQVQRPKKLPFYTRLPSWERYLKKTERFRNHDQVRINLIAKYGKLQTFLSEQEEEKKKTEIKETVEEAQV